MAGVTSLARYGALDEFQQFLTQRNELLDACGALCAFNGLLWRPAGPGSAEVGRGLSCVQLT